MAGIIFDGKTVSPAIVVEKEIEKTKFGASIDSFLGDVDENGAYVKPTEPFIVDLTGVKSVGHYALTHAFYRNASARGIVANDVVSVGVNAFNNAFNAVGSSLPELNIVSFNAIEEINSSDVFTDAFRYRKIKSVSFKNLKRVSGNNVFKGAFYYGNYAPDSIFPVLEEIGGNQCFYDFMSFIGNKPVRLSKVKKIVGGSSSYNATFYTYTSNMIWHFPSATELSGYVFYSSGDTKEIHFAAQNQATIEALPDYATKFGATNATIFFDLILTITVNGVAYEREHTIDGYTSWKDASGNLVYTDETAEPAVGTIVYSDQGTTQVGTVEGVA